MRLLDGIIEYITATNRWFYGNLNFNRDRQDLQDKKTRFTMKNMKLGTRENVFNHEKHEKTRKKSVSELWRVFPPH